MRVNFIAQTSPSHNTVAEAGLISLTVRPACGVPGDYFYSTDRHSLLRMLRRETELRSAVLDRFEKELNVTKAARLLGVEMSEKALTDIGYFVD